MFKIKSTIAVISIPLMMFASTAICFGATVKLAVLDIPDDQARKLSVSYEKSHKGMSVKLLPIHSQTDCKAVLAQKPDVFVGSQGYATYWLEQSNLADLNSLLPKNTYKSFIPGIYDSLTVRGHQLAVPLFSGLSQLEYNVTMFKREGVKPPDDSWTWDGKFFDACRKLSKDLNGDGIIDQFGVLGFPIASDYYLTTLYSYGGGLIDKAQKKIVYTDKPAMDSIDFISRLHKAHMADEFDLTMMSPKNMPFFNGKSGMQITQNSAKLFAKAMGVKPNEFVDFESDTVSIPMGPKGAVPVAYPAIAGIFKNSDNVKAAVDFISYLTSADGQSVLFDIFVMLPATYDGLKYRRVVDIIDPAVMKSYSNSKGRLFTKAATEIERSFWDDVYKMIIGKLSRAEFESNAKNRESELLK